MASKRKPFERGERVFDEVDGVHATIKQIVIWNSGDSDEEKGERLLLRDANGLEWERDPSLCRRPDEPPYEGVYTDKDGRAFYLDGKGGRRAL